MVVNDARFLDGSRVLKLLNSLSFYSEYDNVFSSYTDLVDKNEFMNLDLVI